MPKLLQPRQPELLLTTMNIENLCKVTVEIDIKDSFCKSGKKKDKPIRFDFIYGTARSGLTEFELKLHHKTAGDSIDVSLPGTRAPEYFGHTYKHLHRKVSLGIVPEIFDVSVTIIAVQRSEEREVVKAMAQSLGHGCGGGSCDCGCS